MTSLKAISQKAYFWGGKLCFPWNVDLLTLEKKALVYRICPCLLCKHRHHGWFQATAVKSRNAEMGRDMQLHTKMVTMRGGGGCVHELDCGGHVTTPVYITPLCGMPQKKKSWVIWIKDGLQTDHVTPTSEKTTWVSGCSLRASSLTSDTADNTASISRPCIEFPWPRVPLLCLVFPSISDTGFSSKLALSLRSIGKISHA